MEKGDTDLSKLIRSTKHMSVHMIMYYWSEMLITVNEIHNKGKLLLQCVVFKLKETNNFISRQYILV